MQTKQISDTLLSMTVNLLTKYDPQCWLVASGVEVASSQPGIKVV